MRVFNQTRNIPLITQGRLADTFWRRLRGLMGVTFLREEEGLILVGEKSIHTFFMKIPIDVVYVDQSYRVIRTEANMIPSRIGPFVSRSVYVLELPVGTIARTMTQVGDQLKFES